jgi:hypothetical protein
MPPKSVTGGRFIIDPAEYKLAGIHITIYRYKFIMRCEAKKPIYPTVELSIRCLLPAAPGTHF